MKQILALLILLLVSCKTDKKTETAQTNEAVVENPISDNIKLEIHDFNGLEKYFDSTTLFTKGTPIHVRGALAYNYFREENDLAKALADEALAEWLAGLSGLRTIVSDSLYNELPL